MLFLSSSERNREDTWDRHFHFPAGWCEGLSWRLGTCFLCFVGALSTSWSSLNHKEELGYERKALGGRDFFSQKPWQQRWAPVRTAVPGSAACSGEGARKRPRFCLGCRWMSVHNVVSGEKTDITLRCLCIVWTEGSSGTMILCWGQTTPGHRVQVSALLERLGQTAAGWGWGFFKTLETMFYGELFNEMGIVSELNRVLSKHHRYFQIFGRKLRKWFIFTRCGC